MIAFILSLSFSIHAGDVKIGGYIVGNFAQVGEPYEVDVNFTNNEDFDVLDFHVNYSICKIIGDLTYEVVYEYDKTGMTVPANSELSVNNSDIPWIPLLQGAYELWITTTASNDINPDNDDIVIKLTANKFLILQSESQESCNRRVQLGDEECRNSSAD